jgi:hypothetical protein
VRVRVRVREVQQQQQQQLQQRRQEEEAKARTGENAFCVLQAARLGRIRRSPTGQRVSAFGAPA